MNTIKCQAFLESVEQGSILGAAQRLGYTPSGVNRMINALEDELGVILFARSRKGVSLTFAGETLLPLIRQFVNCREQILQTCAELNGLVSGRLKIGSYYSVAAHKLPKLIEQFSNVYPGIQIDLVEDGLQNLMAMLKGNCLDCCIIGDPQDNEVDFLPLMEDQIVAWLPLTHPLAKAPSFPISELSNGPFITMIEEKRDIVNRLIERYSLQLNIRYSTRDAYTTYRMVAAGLGISANNALTNQDWPDDVAVLPLDPPQTVPIGLAVPVEQQLPPAVVRFINFVKDHWEISS